MYTHSEYSDKIRDKSLFVTIKIWNNLWLLCVWGGQNTDPGRASKWLLSPSLHASACTLTDSQQPLLHLAHNAWVPPMWEGIKVLISDCFSLLHRNTLNYIPSTAHLRSSWDFRSWQSWGGNCLYTNWETQRKYAIYCKYLRVILLNHIFVNSFHGRKTTMMSKKTSFVGRARTSWNSSKAPVKREKETGEGHHLDVLTIWGSMLERQKSECSFSVLHLVCFILRGQSCLVWPVACSRGIVRPHTNTFLVLGVFEEDKNT